MLLKSQIKDVMIKFPNLHLKEEKLNVVFQYIALSRDKIKLVTLSEIHYRMKNPVV